MYSKDLLGMNTSTNITTSLDNSSYRLIFYLEKKDEIYHYSSKEHPKISKIELKF